MKIITLDFETFYSTEYSLSRMTTEEYVRGSEFEVIGVSVQEDDGEPVWFSGSMLQTEKFLKQYDWKNSLMLAHNTAFDGAIMGWLFDIHPKGLLDTLSMGRALHGTEVGGGPDFAEPDVPNSRLRFVGAPFLGTTILPGYVITLANASAYGLQGWDAYQAAADGMILGDASNAFPWVN